MGLIMRHLNKNDDKSKKLNTELRISELYNKIYYIKSDISDLNIKMNMVLSDLNLLKMHFERIEDKLNSNN